MEKSKHSNKLIWSQEEVSFLKANYGEMAIDEIGKKLGISHATVRTKALSLGLMPRSKLRIKQWSDEQIDYLTENYPTKTLSDLALHIGFSTPTIQRKAQELGLVRSESYDIRKFYRRYVNNYRNEGRPEGNIV